MKNRIRKRKEKSINNDFRGKCYPDNTTILKRLLCRISASDDMPPNNDTIHFVAYGLHQYTISELYRMKILKQINFLHNIAVILIVNIDSDIIYNQSHYKLLSSISIKGIKKTHLIHSKEK